jgi:hypothetical protein
MRVRTELAGRLMIFNWFKKKPKAVSVEIISAAEPEESSPLLPWEKDGGGAAIPANSAAACLREFLLASLTTEKGVDAEILMVVTGALAGFSAQHAVWETIVKPGKPIAPGGFRDVKAGNGETYYCGALATGFLAPQLGAACSKLGAACSMWELIARAALQAGAPKSKLPDCKEIFTHVERTVGGPDFGLPRMPEGRRLSVAPRDALNVFWPQTKLMLSRTDFPGAAGVGLPPEHWPLVIGVAAQQYIAMTRDALDPIVALQLIMEAAAAMAKVDPDVVRQTPLIRRRAR